MSVATSSASSGVGLVGTGAPASTRLTFSKTVKKKRRAYELPKPLAPLADTHAHLTCFWEKTPAEVLVRAAQAGVQKLVTLWDPVADSFDSFDAYRTWLGEQLAAARAAAEDAGAPLSLFDDIHFLVGVHPYGVPDFTSHTDEICGQMRAALEDPLCAGVGEIGLDYHFDADDNVPAAPHDVQLACLEQQLALAHVYHVPVELHVRNDNGDEMREAHADAYRVLQTVGLPQAGCILHCFTEDRPTAEHFVELGCYVAFGGAATFKRNEEIREAFTACPLNRILFETDCPYMAPEPLRGTECEPAMVGFTADALARYRSARTGEAPEAIEQAAWDNALVLFG